MSLGHGSTTPHSTREWIYEHPLAALCAAGIVGLLGGSLINQYFAQRQVGQELVRLTDACLDSHESVQRLTAMKPTIDGTRSLLAELKQTERELDAGVQSLGGIRNLGFDLAEVRRQIGTSHQTVKQLDTMVDDLNTQSSHVLLMAQNPLQQLQTIDILLQQQSDLVPQLQTNLYSLLELSRTLQQEGGNALAAQESMQLLLSNQNRLIGVLNQIDKELSQIDQLDGSIQDRMTSAREVIASAEAMAQEAQRIHQSLLDAQQYQHRAQRNLQQLLGLSEQLAVVPTSSPSPVQASTGSTRQAGTRLVVQPQSPARVSTQANRSSSPEAAQVPAVPISNRSESISGRSEFSAPTPVHVPNSLGCEETDATIVPADSQSRLMPGSSLQRTGSLSSRRTVR